MEQEVSGTSTLGHDSAVWGPIRVVMVKALGALYLHRHDRIKLH